MEKMSEGGSRGGAGTEAEDGGGDEVGGDPEAGECLEIRDHRLDLGLLGGFTGLEEDDVFDGGDGR